MCASLRSTQDRVVSREAAARIVVLAASAQHFLIVPVIEVPRRYAAPRNETEEGLVAIWQEMLGIERVGVEDNFFEIGGHSLLAMSMISRIRKEMEVEIVIKDIFEFTTISLLAKYLEIQHTGKEGDAADFELFDI